ncbi:MAG: HlyD family type I secretion periplasmic adaptor subunit [Cohaesibacter sp.]|nr:HlyD family type I secretion periplasmic adaptor subunit [Cohaesibacter sp.]
MNATDLSSQHDLQKSLSHHLRWSAFIIFLLIAGVGLWLGLLQISSAVVATGSIVVEGNIKRVQHQEGGIVKEIHVRDGDRVRAGDVLIRLDDTVPRANLFIADKQLVDLRLQLARLMAEQQDSETPVFPDLASSAFSSADIEDLRFGQQKLFEARRQSYHGRKLQLSEQISQLSKQIDGLSAQQKAKQDEIVLLNNELEANAKLWKRKLVTLTKFNSLKREKAKMQGELGEVSAAIAQARNAMSEKELQILQIEEDTQTDILQQIQDIKAKIAQLEEQEITALDQLKRIDILAPQSGLVHQSNTHTVGGVIPPAEVLMLIVPQEDRLIIEAQVDPVQIDRLSPNQNARIRFPAFDQRTTPEIEARLDRISADLIQDQATGLSFYKVRLIINEQELQKLNGKHLIPGMPSEVYLQTGYRSILSYLTKPITDQIQHALRER